MTTSPTEEQIKAALEVMVGAPVDGCSSVNIPLNETCSIAVNYIRVSPFEGRPEGMAPMVMLPICVDQESAVAAVAALLGGGLQGVKQSLRTPE